MISRKIPIADGKTVSGLIARPDGFEPGRGCAVFLAHGAGNDMTSPVVSAVHEGLAARGYLTVKFNFPYTEAGRKAPDRAPVLEACYRAVVAAVRDDPELRPRSVVLGGKSMGGRMASHLAAQGHECAGLLFLGYPLHPPRQTDRLRVAHLGQIRAPMLFFAGTRDPLCDLELLRRAVADLTAPVTLHVVDGGDHSFAVPKRMGRSQSDVLDEIIQASADWLASLGNREPQMHADERR